MLRTPTALISNSLRESDMSQSTGMALLPAVEVSLAALGLAGNDRDLAEEARRTAAAIDDAGRSALALKRLGPRLLTALDALGASPAGRAVWKAADCIICEKPIPAKRRRRATTCSALCSELYRQARLRNREHVRRSAVSDITPEQELAMRRKARKCPMPGCGVRLTGKLGLPNSKHLDHIVPLGVHGTHTHGNVRIICAACNLKRPKDGSDYFGPVTLWAQGEIQVKRPRKQRTGNVATCRKGLHPWVAENIGTGSTGKNYCRACRKAIDRACSPLRPCARCGMPAAMQGSQAMCPACTDTAAREAAELHGAGGLTWDQIAPLVGYGSGWGVAYAAKRIGYVPAPKGAKVPSVPTCPNCGRPRANRARWCAGCTRTKATEAATRYTCGASLRDIADWLGYDSITSVSNLIKSTGAVEMRIGRPSLLPPNIDRCPSA